ncbi:MAG: hypothetical protein A2X59_12260 [Nitrospirae bacterium GWC2_42_7]|nr:MAG: hypothetical protein A2X59_12260 [Nitrospirae bacterium GWC2_42_7]
MKNYRIVRIAGMGYKAAIEKLYSKDKGLYMLSYAEQQKTLFDMAYVYSDGFSRGMRSLGHDAHEIVYDLEILQKKWAEEKGVKFNPENWQSEIILRQIEDLKPDIVYFQDIYSLPLSIRRQLKSIFPFIKLVVIFRGYPGGIPDILIKELMCADILLLGSPVLMEKLRAGGLMPHLVYHSFDEAILEAISKDKTKENSSLHYDLTFIGSSGFGRGWGHISRYWFLSDLIKKTNLALWLDEGEDKQELQHISLKEILKKPAKILLSNLNTEMLMKLSMHEVIPEKARSAMLGIMQEKKNMSDNTKRLPEKRLSEIYPGRCNPPVFGLEMYKILQRSNVTFNIHSDAAQGTVDNMRMFQATGVGTCLLTDTGWNMSDLFEADREVVTYSNINECIEKAKYLLEHEDVRQRIATAGQKRTLKVHNMLNRCRQLDEIIQRRL